MKTIDTKKLKNGKYFHGRYTEFDEYKGWFVGSFFEDGHPCKTDDLEVVFRNHKKGNSAEAHFHRNKVELLLIIEGKAKYNINGEELILKKGDFLFVDVNNIISGEYLENTKMFAIHSPSITTDKEFVKMALLEEENVIND